MVIDPSHGNCDNSGQASGETRRPDNDAELQQEIHKGRKFSLAEAIGRLAGPGAMKGVSPIARKQQAEAEIETWLRRNLATAEDALGVVLLRHVKESELLLNNYDQPLIVLAACCQQILDSDDLLKRLVRAADIEWGRIFGQQPYFEEEGSAPNSEDPYTVESVEIALSRLIAELATQGA
jgi:hypothetical protein